MDDDNHTDVLPRWASTDLRWRNSKSSSNNNNRSTSRTSSRLGGFFGRGLAARRTQPSPTNADTPPLPIHKDYVEDYGSDDDDDGSSSRGIFGLGGGRRRGRGRNKLLPSSWDVWVCLWRFRHTTFTLSFIASLAVITSVIATEFTPQSQLVMMSSTLTILVVILLFYQQRKLRKLGTLRHQNNQLRRSAHYFRQERERLHRTLDRMDETMVQLHSIPQELHELTKNNRNTDRLIEMIHEKKQIQERMRKKINQQIMQQILSVVLREDRDGNGTLRPTEIESLIIRLGMIDTVEFDERLFRQRLSHEPTISTIMKIIRSLLERDDEYYHSKPIFKIKDMTATTTTTMTEKTRTGSVSEYKEEVDTEDED